MCVCVQTRCCPLAKEASFDTQWKGEIRWRREGISGGEERGEGERGGGGTMGDSSTRFSLPTPFFLQDFELQLRIFAYFCYILINIIICR